MVVELMMAAAGEAKDDDEIWGEDDNAFGGFAADVEEERGEAAHLAEVGGVAVVRRLGHQVTKMKVAVARLRLGLSGEDEQ